MDDETKWCQFAPVVSPVSFWQLDFDNLIDEVGNEVSSSRTLSDMYVNSINFCGESDNWVAMDWIKDSEENRVINWRTKSKVALSLPQENIPPFKKEGPRVSSRLKVHIRKRQDHDCGPRDRRNNGSTFALISRFDDKEVYTEVGEYEDNAYCFSSDGNYLARVNAWEDGDMREDPSLEILDISGLLCRLEQRAIAPFLHFRDIIQQREQKGKLRKKGTFHPIEDASSSPSFSLSGIIVSTNSSIYQETAIIPNVTEIKNASPTSVLIPPESTTKMSHAELQLLVWGNREGPLNVILSYL